MQSQKTVLRKLQLIGTLEKICQALELTETQYGAAKAHYEAVGKWLSESESNVLRTAIIYPQGSVSYGTTVRPVRYQEFDLDLVSYLPSLPPSIVPAFVKKLVGDRLKKHSYYKSILEEKARCWRLNYANEFHLDITPSIPNPQCIYHGELVPDKDLNEWKPTNPKGYSDWVNKIAELQPRIQLKGDTFRFEASIEELPDLTEFKGLLKRCVQLCKRYRDLYFLDQNKEIAPISIIITTLVVKAYEFCVTNFPYETEFDVLLDVIRRMPDFIESHIAQDGQLYFIPNVTTEGENFAEKWNRDSRLPRAFDLWQKNILSVFQRINEVTGMDQLYMELAPAFGDQEVKTSMEKFTAAVSAARAGNFLSASPLTGLTVNNPKRMKILSNTFYGV